MSSSKFLTALLAVVAGLPLRPVGATDAQFTRALNQAGCIPAHVAVIREEKGITAYKVSCVGNPPRNVDVYCAKDACSVSADSDSDEPRV